MGFLVFYAIALAGDSAAALILGVFQHAAIHVHRWCTEGPDMELLYGSTPTPGMGGAQSTPAR